MLDRGRWECWFPSWLGDHGQGSQPICLVSSSVEKDNHSFFPPQVQGWPCPVLRLGGQYRIQTPVLLGWLLKTTCMLLPLTGAVLQIYSTQEAVLWEKEKKIILGQEAPEESGGKRLFQDTSPAATCSAKTGAGVGKRLNQSERLCWQPSYTPLSCPVHFVQLGFNST